MMDDNGEQETDFWKVKVQRDDDIADNDCYSDRDNVDLVGCGQMGWDQRTSLLNIKVADFHHCSDRKFQKSALVDLGELWNWK